MNESLIQENNNNEEELEAAVNETNLPSQTPQADTPPSYHHFPQTNRHISSSSIHNITELLGSKFWQEANWLDIVCEVLFHVKRRNTTIEFEIYAGVVQFISCMYVLPVIPEQMVNAGYDPDSSYVVTAIMCGVGCIIGGLFANLPFIIAPPTAISIFLSIFLQQNRLDTAVGNQAVVASGIGLIFLGYRPLGRFLSQLIPFPIQVGTAIGVGIGLLTALAGATEIDLVVTGHYTIVKLGKITAEVMVAIAGSTIIGIALHYHIKGAFCLALCFGTVVWWTYDDSWPKSIASVPSVSVFEGFSKDNYQDVILLTFDLLFLYVLTLSGLVSPLATLAGLVRPDNTTPRSRWLFIVCGLCTCLSGLLSGPPILISPESASGIKGGAKTGLSTVVCGLLFSLSVFFNPVFRHVPSAATAPLLIGVGVILFQNVHKLNWTLITDSMPAYFVLFFIPFTYSILQGVAIGYVIYLILGVFSGQIFYSALDLYVTYFGLPFKNWKAQDLPSAHARTTTGALKSRLERIFSTDGTYVEQIHGDKLHPYSPPIPPPSSPTPQEGKQDVPSFDYDLNAAHRTDGIILNPGIIESHHPVQNLPFFPSEESYQRYAETIDRERVGSH